MPLPPPAVARRRRLTPALALLGLPGERTGPSRRPHLSVGIIVHTAKRMYVNTFAKRKELPHLGDGHLVPRRAGRHPPLAHPANATAHAAQNAFPWRTAAARRHTPGGATDTKMHARGGWTSRVAPQ